MSWASRRQSLIAGGVLAVVAAFASVVAFVSLYETPSCTDGKRNQDEEGIDCGGGCAFLCRETVAPPSIRFARAFSSGEGRVNVVAYIDNPNPRAAVKDALFTVELFDASGTAVGAYKGAVDLPAGVTVPVFAPGIAVSAAPTRTFVSFDEASLRFEANRSTDEVPVVTDTLLTQLPTPRLTANVRNDLPYTLYNVHVIATVFDTTGNVMMASETLLSRIAGSATEQAVFTWNTPLPTEPGRIDVVPVLPLR